MPIEDTRLLRATGRMFVEFFAMDFHKNSILMGHDGPNNINVARGKPG